MNKLRRKAIGAIRSKLTEVLFELELVRDDEQEYLDNTPDGLREGQRGDESQDALSSLEESVDYLTSAISFLENF